MLVFVDESGDPGFKFEKGSSTHFVVALAIFNEAKQAEQVNRVINKLKIKLGLSCYSEFKFNKLKDEWKIEFIKAIRISPFKIRALVVDKRLLHSYRLRKKKQFYNYFVGQVFKYHFGSLKKARVHIDGQSGREFRREFQAYVRKKSGGAIIKLKFVDSKKDNLIQLADMVAGSIHRAYRDDHRNNPTYLQLLRPRIQDLWEFDETKRPGT